MQDEKPILFQDEMVRAILRRIKKQTRRVMKVQPSDPENMQLMYVADSTDRKTVGKHHWAQLSEDGYSIVKNDGEYFKCPFGNVGDKLWVREAWGTRYSFPFPPSQLAKSTPIIYRASEPDARVARWYPSIFIPRWASRIILEIKSIRVERLQDISRQDAIDEGLLQKYMPTDGCTWYGHDGENWNLCPVSVFKSLWQSINRKKMPWENNPYVWVVEFEVCDEQ